METVNLLPKNIADPFQRALADVVDQASRGLPPRACAVIYRALAKDFPEHAGMLLRYASLWNSWDSWERAFGA
jgi:hypothetical protein